MSRTLRAGAGWSGALLTDMAQTATTRGLILSRAFSVGRGWCRLSGRAGAAGWQGRTASWEGLRGGRDRPDLVRAV